MELLTNVTDSGDYRLSVENDSGTEVAYVSNTGDLALAGRLYPSAEGALQTDKYIYYDADDDYMRTNAGGWATGSYDFAEMFPSNQSLVAGEVVIFSSDDEHVERSTGAEYDTKIAGIVSTRPGFLAGNDIEGHVPIALAGRVPTFVSTENGNIEIGDPLTTSSIPGYAMKATEAGQVVGYAMESFSGDTGSIVVFVRSSYYGGGPVSDAPAAQNDISGMQNVSMLNVTGGLNMNAGNIISVSAIEGITGSWKLKQDGDIETPGRFIHKIRSYQGKDVATYAAVSTQTTIQLTGTVELQNGKAKVVFEDIDPEFNDIIDTVEVYRVLLTPSGATNQLYAEDRDISGFTVRENGGNTSGVLVDFMVIAYHKDHVPQQEEEGGQELEVEEPVEEIEEVVDEPEVVEEPEVIEELEPEAEEVVEAVEEIEEVADEPEAVDIDPAQE